MELIPHDELRSSPSLNFAPMIDFLFLMLALFAVLAVSRSALLDTEISLAELKAETNAAATRSKSKREPIHISITSDGKYKWLTEFQEYPMETVLAIQDELARQYQLGALPQEKSETEILLHIDKLAPWQQISQLIFAIRETGFTAHPVYEPLEK